MTDIDLKIPNHIGIIVDGNGRWATRKGLSRSMGHKAGCDNIKKMAMIFIAIFFCNKFGFEEETISV